MSWICTGIYSHVSRDYLFTALSQVLLRGWRKFLLALKHQRSNAGESLAKGITARYEGVKFLDAFWDFGWREINAVQRL